MTLSHKLNPKSNKFLMPVLTLAVIFSLLLVALGSWHAGKIAKSFKTSIVTEFRLQELSGDIIHLDEVLTMSARMAATTGDLQWENRYRQFEPQLDAAIKEAIALAPEAYESHAAETDAANLKLVEMENRAFKLVRQGRRPEALELLFNNAYITQKRIYADGMLATTTALQQRVQDSLAAYGSTLSWSSFFSWVSFWVLMGAWLVILLMVNRYIRRRKQAEQRLKHAKAELEKHHAKLQTSEAALRQKATILERTLQELRQTQVKMIQSEKMSSLGQLVAGVAHEINNPVNFISGNLKYAREYADQLLQFVEWHQTPSPQTAADIQAKIEDLELGFIQEDFPKVLDSMKLGTDRIEQIVRSLRNFSRMDEAEFKAVDIHEGIDSTLLILQHRLKGKGDRPEIEVVKEYGPIPLVECYVGSLNQVFMNILSNAIDALEEAYQEALPGDPNTQIGHISIRTAKQGADWITIAIADTGPGMSDAIKQKIFDPFFTTKPVGKGTGMGMPISYQIIVEKHQGKLECLSTPHQGTKFVIQIPIQQTSCPPA